MKKSAMEVLLETKMERALDGDAIRSELTKLIADAKFFGIDTRDKTLSELVAEVAVAVSAMRSADTLKRGNKK